MSDEMVARNTQEALAEISKQLARLATKDVMEQLLTKLMDRIEKPEGRVFDLETERDSLKADVQTIKQENRALKQQLQGLKRSTETRHNDLEQYQRRWNLRIFGVKETQNEDCVQKCLQIIRINDSQTNESQISESQNDSQIAPVQEPKARPDLLSRQPQNTTEVPTIHLNLSQRTPARRLTFPRTTFFTSSPRITSATNHGRFFANFDTEPTWLKELVANATLQVS
nr:hypothetical protein BaRGS_006769 [Batillaria attramentaria]